MIDVILQSYLYLRHVHQNMVLSYEDRFKELKQEFLEVSDTVWKRYDPEDRHRSYWGFVWDLSRSIFKFPEKPTIMYKDYSIMKSHHKDGYYFTEFVHEWKSHWWLHVTDGDNHFFIGLVNDQIHIEFMNNENKFRMFLAMDGRLQMVSLVKSSVTESMVYSNELFPATVSIFVSPSDKPPIVSVGHYWDDKNFTRIANKNNWQYPLTDKQKFEIELRHV